MKRIASLIIVLFVHTACVAEDEGTWTVKQEIMGGEVENQLTAIVGIAIVRGNQSSICSGTLIAPNLVLTAQHCVAELASPQVICGQSPFGALYSANDLFVTFQTQMSNNGADYVNVAEVVVPPGASDTCGGDIAVLRLANNVPTVVAEPIIPRIDLPVFPSERYTAYGYGHVGDFTGSGTRRRLANREIICGGDQLCNANSGVDSAEFAGTQGTCQGDSGGAPIDAQGRVLGALSRGPDGCAGSVYSAVFSWADWLRQQGERAATAGGYTPPAWVSMGVSEIPMNDPDLDGLTSDVDNCPDVANPDQLDMDADGTGDVCDGDSDGDSVADDVDNCPLMANTDQFDHDGDLFGDACDPDDDADGIDDIWDTCPLVANPSQTGPCGNTQTPSQIPTPTVDEDLTLVVHEEPRSKTIEMTGHMCATRQGAAGGMWLWLVGAIWLIRVRRKRSV